MNDTAQCILSHLSLSLSLVLKASLLCHANESPAVPEYEPTSSRYFTCSSPILNLPYLACALLRSSHPVPPSKIWVYRPSACGSCRFLTRTQPSADQSLICTRSSRYRSPQSHPVFSRTRSTLHHQCACHSIQGRLHLGSQSTLHFGYSLI